MVPRLSIAVRVGEKTIVRKPFRKFEIVSATCATVRPLPRHEEVIRNIGCGGRAHGQKSDLFSPHCKFMLRYEL